MRDYVAEATAGVLVNIGQITPAGCRALARAVREGKLAQWRGYWHPVPGAAFGIGPLKTCYGRPDVAALLDGGLHGTRARAEEQPTP
jgi:hypothetical protein